MHITADPVNWFMQIQPLSSLPEQAAVSIAANMLLFQGGILQWI